MKVALALPLEEVLATADTPVQLPDPPTMRQVCRCGASIAHFPHYGWLHTDRPTGIKHRAIPAEIAERVNLTISHWISG